MKTEKRPFEVGKPEKGLGGTQAGEWRKSQFHREVGKARSGFSRSTCDGLEGLTSCSVGGGVSEGENLQRQNGVPCSGEAVWKEEAEGMTEGGSQANTKECIFQVSVNAEGKHQWREVGNQVSQFAQLFPGFSTESPMCWESPQFWGNWGTGRLVTHLNQRRLQYRRRGREDGQRGQPWQRWGIGAEESVGGLCHPCEGQGHLRE